MDTAVTDRLDVEFRIEFITDELAAVLQKLDDSGSDVAVTDEPDIDFIHGCLVFPF